MEPYENKEDKKEENTDENNEKMYYNFTNPMFKQYPLSMLNPMYNPMLNPFSNMGVNKPTIPFTTIPFNPFLPLFNNMSNMNKPTISHTDTKKLIEFHNVQKTKPNTLPEDLRKKLLNKNRNNNKKNNLQKKQPQLTANDVVNLSKQFENLKKIEILKEEEIKNNLEFIKNTILIILEKKEKFYINDIFTRYSIFSKFKISIEKKFLFQEIFKIFLISYKIQSINYSDLYNFYFFYHVFFLKRF